MEDGDDDEDGEGLGNARYGSSYLFGLPFIQKRHCGSLSHEYACQNYDNEMICLL